MCQNLVLVVLHSIIILTLGMWASAMQEMIVNLTSMSLHYEKSLKYPEWAYTGTGKTSKLHTEKPQQSQDLLSVK